MTAEATFHAPYWMVAPRLPGTPLSYRRQPLWYVAEVVRPARRANLAVPEWILRAALGALVVVVGLWLIPDKGSEKQALPLGVAIFLLAGAVAGPRSAWVAIPVGGWLMIATYTATDCADCGGGGEEVAPPLLVYAGMTLALAALGLAGSGISAFARVPLPSRTVLLSCLVVLFAAFISLALLRSIRSANVNGDIVFERDGVRFRSGEPVGNPARAIDLAAAGLSGEAPVWLGETVGSFNLAAVQNAPELFVVYGACGPAPCTPPITVMHRWTCSTPPEVKFARSPVETRPDGAVVVHNAVGGDERAGLTKAVIWTGHLEVTVYAQAEAANANDLIQQLRRLDGQPLAPAANGC